MSEFGALNRWVNRLLDGSVPKTDAGESTNKESVQPETELKGNGLSRRTVLAGGVATVVTGPEKIAETVGQAVVQNIPSAAAAMGIGEAAKGLIQKKIAHMAAAMGNDFLLMSLQENTEDSEDMLETMLSGAGDLAESLKSGVKGIEAKKLAEVGETLNQSEMFGKFFSPDLTIADLSNKELVTTAYGLGGPQRIQGVDINIDKVSKIGELLKKMSGLPDGASLSEVQKAMRNKRIDIAKEILGNLNAFPDATTRQDSLTVLQQMLQDSEGEAEHELFSQVIDARRENLPAYEAETKEKEKQKEEERAREASEKLEKRGGIYCKINRVASNDEHAGKTFRIKPQGALIWGVSRGLSRMHIENWKQAEYKKAKKLNEYASGGFKLDEQVEDPELGVLVAMEDPLMLSILEEAAKTGSMVILPNRIQDIPHVKDK